MTTSTSRSVDPNIGQVFTPLPWAHWLIARWAVFEAWLEGARICDPTAGQGAFALALLEMAQRRNIAITEELLSRLTLIELRESNLETFLRTAKDRLGVDFPASRLVARDVIRDTPTEQFDVLVGNPPWSNFADLPTEYKELLKPHFVAQGLVPDKRGVLLGASRTDIAALVVKVALGKLLKHGGWGCFFLPTSLFCGDDAHAGFRDYSANGRAFAVREVFEFTSTKVFEVGTSYCCARFTVDRAQEFPVKYYREVAGAWEEDCAVPLQRPTDPWRVIPHGAAVEPIAVVDVGLSPQQAPRQGANTCGANAAFIFDAMPPDLPAKYLFPLAGKGLWRKGSGTPEKWILLPYDADTGRPLSWLQIESHEGLRNHLLKVRPLLEARRGVLIGSAISKGIWWAQLGVGPYSFAPYKVMWEAYGGKHFEPKVLGAEDGQPWQGNQAMHAFIPCWSEGDARRLAQALRQPAIVELLRQLNGTGKCNWAQPGKIKKVLGLAPSRQPSSAW